jgi:methylated-DNA-[protein]-cysteine S-methyltransferase
MESPIGRLLLAGDDSELRLIQFPEGKRAQEPQPGWVPGERPLSDVVRQLKAYFAGKLQEFDLNLRMDGTPFQQGVWRALRDIPYGETISYGELARRVGNPKGSRAVGHANGANPIPIVVPCHRVIGSNGKLTGFGGGLPTKEKLLTLERDHATLAETLHYCRATSRGSV